MAFHAHLAVAETVHHQVAQRYAQLSGDTLSQNGVSVASE
jgi:hypothetical protein